MLLDIEKLWGFWPRTRHQCKRAKFLWSIKIPKHVSYTIRPNKQHKRWMCPKNPSFLHMLNKCLTKIWCISAWLLQKLSRTNEEPFVREIGKIRPPCMPKRHRTEINGIKDWLLIKLKLNQGRDLCLENPENSRFPCMPKNCLTKGNGTKAWLLLTISDTFHDILLIMFKIAKNVFQHSSRMLWRFEHCPSNLLSYRTYTILH